MYMVYALSCLSELCCVGRVYTVVLVSLAKFKCYMVGSLAGKCFMKCIPHSTAQDTCTYGFFLTYTCKFKLVFSFKLNNLKMKS